jgi:DNA-binding CsgD family transcriptional regulator
MDRDQLNAWLDAGLSLPQIGMLTNRDPSTVGYWVQKYRLTANGKERYAPRGGLTREQLEPLVERGATLQQIAEELGRSVSTIRHWLRKYGLRTRNRRGLRTGLAREEIELALKNGARTLTRECKRHGETTFVIENSGRTRCRRCRMERVVEWRRRKKATLVAEAGGRCQRCGYDRCFAALEFHHLDPKTKSFALSLRGVTRSLDACRAEAEKCALLCANCHAEVEVGAASLPADIARPR